MVMGGMMNDSENISQETLKELLDYNPNTGVLTWKRRDLELFKDTVSGKIWNSNFTGKEAGCTRTNGYIWISIFDKRYSAHRLIWMYLHGYFPEEIDHKNHNTTDNSENNLREVTHQENGMNQKMFSTNTTGVTGVYRNKLDKNWKAGIRANKVSMYLGIFDSFF